MGGVTRETFIPDAVNELQKYDKNDPERRRLARDVEEENGGAGVYNVDLKADYILENPDWKYDKIPEVFDGKNVYDFIDPDIDAKLQALEEEEERLEAEGYYESDEELDDAEEEDIHMKAELIREKQALIRNEGKMRKSLKNRAIIPRKAMKKPLSELEEALDVLGVDTEDLHLRARAEVSTGRGRSLSRSRLGTEDPNAMDVDTPRDRLRSKSRARSQPATNRREDGVQNEETRTKVERQAKVAQRKMNRMARQGEADRHIGTTMPKHLVSHPGSEGCLMSSLISNTSRSLLENGRLVKHLDVKDALAPLALFRYDRYYHDERGSRYTMAFWGLKRYVSGDNYEILQIHTLIHRSDRLGFITVHAVCCRILSVCFDHAPH